MDNIYDRQYGLSLHLHIPPDDRMPAIKFIHFCNALAKDLRQRKAQQNPTPKLKLPTVRQR